MCNQSQGYYGSNNTLSPAAQAVKDAVIALYSDQQQIRDWGWRLDAPTVAAVLEAAADQVVPEHKPWHRTGGEPAARHKVRLELLTIAAELRGQNQPSSEEL